MPVTDKKKPGNDLLSHGLCRSTIGAGGLNFRVRNGNGWVPAAMVTRQFETHQTARPPPPGAGSSVRARGRRGSYEACRSVGAAAGEEKAGSPDGEPDHLLTGW